MDCLTCHKLYWSCILSHNWGEVSNACASLMAMVGLIPALPLTICDNCFCEIFSPLDASVMESPSGLR